MNQQLCEVAMAANLLPVVLGGVPGETHAAPHVAPVRPYTIEMPMPEQSDLDVLSAQLGGYAVQLMFNGTPKPTPFPTPPRICHEDHVVEKGDTVSRIKIEEGWDISWKEVKDLNGLDDKYTIYEGKKLHGHCPGDSIPVMKQNDGNQTLVTVPESGTWIAIGTLLSLGAVAAYAFRRLPLNKKS